VTEDVDNAPVAPNGVLSDVPVVDFGAADVAAKLAAAAAEWGFFQIVGHGSPSID
jgi:isopenicillin N synthase-like dioxygenase